LLGTLGGMEGLRQVWQAFAAGGGSGLIAFLLGGFLVVPFYLLAGYLFGGLLGLTLGLCVGPLMQAGQKGGRRWGGLWAHPVTWRVAHGLIWLAAVVAAYLGLEWWHGDLQFPGAAKEPSVGDRVAEQQRAMLAQQAAMEQARAASDRIARTGKQTCEGKWCYLELGSLPEDDVISIWGSADDDVWFARQHNSVLHWDGKSLTVGDQKLLKIRGSKAGTAFALDESSVWRWNGAAWLELDIPLLNEMKGEMKAEMKGDRAVKLLDLWVTRGGDLWLLLNRTYPDGATLPNVLHFNGHKWTQVLPKHAGFSPSAIWARDAGDAWLVGWAEGNDTTAALHWNGSAWKASRGSGIAGQSLEAVWGNRSAVWTVGYGGTALLWKGTAWADTDTGTESTLHAVAGLADGSVWAVGKGHTILAWDGRKWTPMPSPSAPGREPPEEYLCIFSTDDTLWIGGSRGAIVHRIR
jgi:hypothetical protein